MTAGTGGTTTPQEATDPTLRDLAPESRLRRLELTITRRLDGLLHGQHLGLLPGPGSEFAGSREYRPGEDEVRRMDWAVTARTAVPHVREVDADRESSTWLLVDASPSMDFGTAELDKRELAVAAVAAVGFLTAGIGNRLGAYVCGPDRMRRFPPGTGRAHLLGLLRTMLTVPRGTPGPSGTPAAVCQGVPDTDDWTRAVARTGQADRGATEAAGPTAQAGDGSLAAALDGLRHAAPRRGLAVVVSDFLDGLPDTGSAPPDWERPLRRLASRHQVLAVDISDPRELDLPDVGVITLIDPETGLRREVSTGDRRLRDRFAAAAADQRAQIGDALRRAGATRLELRTDRDWVADIVRHVHIQRRLAGAARPARVPGGAR